MTGRMTVPTRPDLREGRDIPVDATPVVSNAYLAAAVDKNDPGFGSVVAQQERRRFLAQDGTAQSRKFGTGTQRTERFYLAALGAPWPTFLLWLVGGMLLINGVFALLYLSLGAQALQPNGELGLRDPFIRALSYSVGVFTTTGSDMVRPVGDTAHWLTIFESLVGPILLIGAGGLLVARLTRPRVNIRFSSTAVIAPYHGGRGLMFRMVNMNPGELSDVNVRVNLSIFETVNGARQRRFHRLALERASVEFFTLHWTVVHPIDAESPLAGMTPAQLREAQPEVLVLVHAHEETFSTRVTAKTSYISEEIRWDVKFADMFVQSDDGVVTIDVERLDRTDRLEEGATSRPGASEKVTH
jgi:inward rectifier potassium channel